jgi:hypothetical protein
MQCFCCLCLWCNRRNNPALAEQQKRDRQQQQQQQEEEEQGQGRGPKTLKDHPYQVGFGGFLVFQAICALNFGLALLRVGTQKDSLDMFDPATWMDYVDSGHGIFNDDDDSESDCNDPAIYTYTWGEASTKNGMALSAAVIGFSCACGGILYIAVVSSIRSWGGATRTGTAIDDSGGSDVSTTNGDGDAAQYARAMPVAAATGKAVV